MRPTVSEQLHGLRGVLQTAIAPEVTAPYPTDLLATVVGALERLEVEWATVLRAMRDECAALDPLLADARARVAGATASRIDAAGREAPPDWLDPDAARAHYETRRALLADVVRELGPDTDPALRTRIIAHLRDHLAGPL